MVECKKCGKCCKVLGFTIGGLSNDRLAKDYFNKRGCEIKKNTVIVPSICNHLTKDNLCDIHKNKPILCKIYQGQTEIFLVPDGCAYEKKGK